MIGHEINNIRYYCLCFTSISNKKYKFIRHIFVYFFVCFPPFMYSANNFDHPIGAPLCELFEFYCFLAYFPTKTYLKR